MIVTPAKRRPNNILPQRSAATGTACPAMTLVAVMASAGFLLTILALYPGYMTNDAGYVHDYIQQWHFGDWQSPLLTLIWWLIDPISPGSGSMFLLTAALYWAGFVIIALAVARRSHSRSPARSPIWAIAVLVLALAPPAFMLLAMIWRDILFGTVWLLAAAIIYFVADRAGPLRWTAQALGLVLIGIGILLRPNAIVAAPLLIAYAAWPTRMAWKRTALLFIPALFAGYGLIDVVYYRIIAAHRDNPLHSLLVFDLGGITHFTGENQFPVSWSADKNTLLVTRCYDPARWDSYWTSDLCKFVMSRLESKDDVVFGTPRLSQAWLRAVAAHPLAYLSHRLTFLWTFLAGSNRTLELDNLSLPDKTPPARNPYFMTLVAWHDALKSTALFRPGFWLLFAAAVGASAWRARMTPSGAFAISVAASGMVYVLSFAVLGVATDFRYAYWCVLASLAGLVPALLARR